MSKPTLTHADAIKAVREAWKRAPESQAANWAFVDLAEKHLTSILARAEAFERIRALDGRNYVRGFAERVFRIIDEVEAAERGGS